jgi:sirohydrochlorin cobaltochelatase
MNLGENALLILGHGSTVNADSSKPTFAHASEIRRRHVFQKVECAFWKEEPSFRDALMMFPGVGTVFVVPNFISEGYFTETVIPRELELDRPLTKRADGQVWKYCEPVGNHPMMTELLLRRAMETAPGVDASELTLLIVAHGTDLNERSAVAAKREAEKIRATGMFADVMNVYMEEEPKVSEWQSFVRTEHVVVVPFFISDGLHSYEDIPRLLGIVTAETGPGPAGEVYRRNPHRVADRLLYYAPSIGTEAGLADVIIAQARGFAGGDRIS